MEPNRLSRSIYGDFKGSKEYYAARSQSQTHSMERDRPAADGEVNYATVPNVYTKHTSTARADDPVAGLGFETQQHKAYLYNNDPNRPKVFLNILQNKINLKLVKKRNTQVDGTELNVPLRQVVQLQPRKP